jgi:hypothetical protein
MTLMAASGALWRLKLQQLNHLCGSSLPTL